MRPPRRLGMILLAIGCLTTLTQAPRAFAADPPPPTRVTVGRWTVSADGKPLGISISLLDQISERQRELINSGFTTFSQLNLRTVSAQRQVDQSPVVSTSCTVRFDLWQEVYELARIDTKVHTGSVASLDEYGGLCMTAKLEPGPLLDRLFKDGGVLVATLLVDQISAQKAGEIKEWLIRQQSGVMQNLFSHMLGDLKLTERVDVLVQVPPGAGGQRDIEVKSSIGSR